MCTAHSGIALLTTYSRESGGGITSSKGASKSSKDVDDKTSTEIVTEAISKGLKQDRTLRAKAIASKQSTLWWLLKQIKALLIKLGVGNLTMWQITTILLGTYFLWPKLKPNMRLLLNRMHLSRTLTARRSTLCTALTTRVTPSATSFRNPRRSTKMVEASPSTMVGVSGRPRMVAACACT